GREPTRRNPPARCATEHSLRGSPVATALITSITPAIPENMSQPLQPEPPLLSDLVSAPLSRRFFLSRATTPGAAVAAASCARAEEGEGGVATADQEEVRGRLNSNSRADTALDIPHTPSSHTAAVADAATIPYQRFDPVLPPLSAERTLRLHWRATEVPVRISPDTVVAAWTFEDNVPGPIVHGRQGDTIEYRSEA